MGFAKGVNCWALKHVELCSWVGRRGGNLGPGDIVPPKAWSILAGASCSFPGSWPTAGRGELVLFFLSSEFCFLVARVDLG